MFIFYNYWSSRLVWLFFGVLLSGCGGADSDGGTSPPIDYLEYEERIVALGATWNGVATTDPTTLPISGVANYSGYLRLNIETGVGDLALSSTLEIAADFTSDGVTGVASEFVGENSEFYNGSLDITGGFIDRLAIPTNSSTFSANIGGTLNGNSESYLISGDIYGDFLGQSSTGSVGGATGTATSSFGSGYMFGSFLVQQ